MKTKPALTSALESSLIQQIRLRDRVSRVDLARAMDVAPSTVGLYVDRLIRDGFLREGTKARGRAGRPSIAVQLNPAAGQFVGVDFEARQLSAVAVDFSQQIIRREQQTIRASDNAASVLTKIEAAIASVRVPRQPLLGIGVAAPGTVDDQCGLGVHYEFIRGWRNVPLVELISKRFDAPTYLENNVRSMALAERWFGQCQCVENFICIGVRSGIGAGVIINGQLYRGANNLAGEIGGWRCGSNAGEGRGISATLEHRASLGAILQQLADALASGRKSSLTSRPGRMPSLSEVLQAAIGGDRLVVETLRRAAIDVGQVISQLSLVLNPQRIVIAGPLATLQEVFLEPMRDAVATLTPPLHAQPPEIVGSPLGDFGAALGAAAIALHQFTPSR